MKRHVIFYDGQCPLCQRAVRFILSRDREKKFLFASLQGQTAKEELKILPPSFDTLILLENYKQEEQTMLIEGKGALRILWLLGGPFSLLGVLSFLPSSVFDFFYRYIAKRRYQLFKKSLPLIDGQFQDRFLL